MNKVLPEPEEDIFEAIRSFESNSVILNLKDHYPGRIKSNLEYQILGLGNGKWCAVPKTHMIITHYRGEPDYYSSCLPSIYRGNPTKDEMSINIIKQIEFKEICKTFPSVKMSEKDGLDVNYEAIAQHYGLKTEIIDLTTEIAVAAFFATHKYSEIKKSYIPREDGIGVIRRAIGLEMTQYIQDYSGPSFQIIGVQPFFRTAVQQAQGCKCRLGEDFVNISSFILFKQNEEMNKRIGSIFYTEKGPNLLFPDEIIVSAAKEVINSKIVTESAILEYCEMNNCEESTIKRMLLENGYDITEHPVFKLSRPQLRFLERQSIKHPYGGITLTSRLQCFSDD